MSFCHYCTSRWKLWIRPVVMILYMALFLIVFPLLVYRLIDQGVKKEYVATFIAGIFALGCIPISLWDITHHLVHYRQPNLQKHIIRILWMVPIYALNAWLGFIFPQYTIYMDSCREVYEAYVIYNFMIYLLNFLNLEMDLERTLELKPQVKHMFPLCCLPHWEMGKQFIHRCKHGILQYTVIRPLTTLLTFMCTLFGVYHEGEFTADNAYPYMVVFNNITQFVAMYCLVLFYRATQEELRPMNPLGKFLCIKAVVFFSFLQGVVIAILVYTGVISSFFGVKNSDEVHNIAYALQNFLICIEMFMASVAHHFTFTYKPYVDHAAGPQDCCAAFCQMWDVSDVQRDFSEHIDVVANSVRQRLSRGGIYKHSGGSRDERTHLLPDSEQQMSSESEANINAYKCGPPVGYNTMSDSERENSGMPSDQAPIIPTEQKTVTPDDNDIERVEDIENIIDLSSEFEQK